MTIHLVLTPDESGGYFAQVEELPGVLSQGETIEEAALNLCEALESVLKLYRDDGKPVPWVLAY